MAGRTLEDPLAEALRIIDLADGAGLQVRLMGGLAFHARAPEWTARIERARRDIDLATGSSDRRGLSELLVRSGYAADKEFNALHGHKQLYFVDPRRDRPVDVLVDRLEMCHTFDFGERLGQRVFEAAVRGFQGSASILAPPSPSDAQPQQEA